MAGDDHRETPSEGGLRRRRSTPHDNDEISPVEEQEHASSEGFGVPRRTISEPIQGIVPPPSTNETAGTSPDSSHSNTPRVRFSTDVERAIGSSKKDDDAGN